MDTLIPYLPESAPFTAEQRAYLNGFLAGLFSRTPGASMQPAGSEAQRLAPLSILFGSQTGNAERLAKRIVKEAGQRGFAATIHDLANYPVAQLTSEERLLIITSTYGDGDPPDNARSFWQFLQNSAAPRLNQLRYSVCALGDTNYPKFCAFGRSVDERLTALGGQRMHPRVDCDVEFEEPFSKWLQGALSALEGSAASPAPGRQAQASATASPPRESGSSLTPERGYSRQNPVPARLLTNRKLNGASSDKDTRHLEIAWDAAELTYETGDALGILPSNCPDLVDEILRALKCSGEESVCAHDGGEMPLREALLHRYEITKIAHPFLTTMAERSGDPLLQKLAAPGVNGELTRFLYGREVIDLLLAHPAVRFSASEFPGLLKKLQPRLYSIASSPKRCPKQVHLTVAIVRYESLSRRRKGICSTFLADRVAPGAEVPVFIHSNKNFRLPPSGDVPMIMVGPGTGIAPFRAFLTERSAVGAKGRTWLFFGDRCAATDFLYRDELEVMRREGGLTRLDTAFSRDQAEKVYVQRRMREHAKELFAWLEEGACFYVCGDASRMAKDVDAALHEVIQLAGHQTKEHAAEYVARLKAQKRYQRDVY